MNIYPADEQRISEVERGRCFRAVLPSPHGDSFSAGDAILFALAETRGGQEPSYVKGGDSVLVLLTAVTDLDRIDPVTGQALFRVSWKPLGQGDPPAAPARAAKAPRPLGLARPTTSSDPATRPEAPESHDRLPSSVNPPIRSES